MPLGPVRYPGVAPRQGESVSRLPHREKEGFAVRKRIVALVVGCLLLVGLLSGTALAGDEGHILSMSRSSLRQR